MYTFWLTAYNLFCYYEFIKEKGLLAATNKPQVMDDLVQKEMINII